jgi:hypothetical protein
MLELPNASNPGGLFMSQHTQPRTNQQIAALQSEVLAQTCSLFLRPLLVELHTFLDRRLVYTLYQLVFALLVHRHRQQALLLSELGAFLTSSAHAPAGTKRLSNLLHSPHWTVEAILDFLWQLAEQKCSTLWQVQHTPLVIWDESAVEKAESLQLEGLCPVRSTKAARLKRIKPGFFNPPGGQPICVPGLYWLPVLVAGWQGPPVLAHLRCWTARGSLASSRSTERWQPLAELSQLLRGRCHRTGKRSRETSVPLYRLRLALSALWRTYPPSPLPRLDSG